MAQVRNPRRHGGLEKQRWTRPLRLVGRQSKPRRRLRPSKIEQWRIRYNRERPHSSVGTLTSEEFGALAGKPASTARAAPLGQLKNCCPPRSPFQTQWFFALPKRGAGDGPRNC